MSVSVLVETRVRAIGALAGCCRAHCSHALTFGIAALVLHRTLVSLHRAASPCILPPCLQGSAKTETDCRDFVERVQVTQREVGLPFSLGYRRATKINLEDIRNHHQWTGPD